MMDDSLYSDAEVFWDCDSPTPNAWKNLQAPRRNDEDQHCSPQLTRTKRVSARTLTHMDNNPRFEQSRKEVHQIISALRRVSKEGADAPISKFSHTGRLLIPEMPEEGEDSEDERDPTNIPLFKAYEGANTNTSIDLLFDMSGNGENIAPTATNVKPAKLKHLGSNPTVLPQAIDVWTDDDLFTDDVLMLEIDKLPSGNRPVKLHGKPSNASTPKVSSTHSSPVFVRSKRKADMNSISTSNTPQSSTAETNAKGFLDFFMDDDRPVKPSPNKQKLTISTNYNYKFSSRTGRSTSPNHHKDNASTVTKADGTEDPAKDEPKPMDTSVFSNSPRKKFYCLNESKKAPKTAMLPSSTTATERKEHVAKKCGTKPLDTSIPLDVLEELIMEDSWTDSEEMKLDETDVKLVPKEAQSTPNFLNAVPKSSCVSNTSKGASKQNTTYKFCAKKARASVREAADVKHNLNSLTKTKSTSKSSNQLNGVHRQLASRSNDGFSSDDDDLLMEAVALSESQQATKDAFLAKKTEVKNLPAIKKPSVTSQPKCTASEIEKKKQMAMERRAQRLRKQQLSRR